MGKYTYPSVCLSQAGRLLYQNGSTVNHANNVASTQGLPFSDIKDFLNEDAEHRWVD